MAERKNGHLLKTTQALLFIGKVPKNYWGEVVLTTTYIIINRLPSRTLETKIPVEILNSFFLDGLIPRIFRCMTFAHVPSQNLDKLEPRAIRCVFLGYSATKKGYNCFNPTTKKWYIFANVTFLETPFFL